MSIIDSNSDITDVETRASHPSLKKEAKRVIQSLPKMKPGIQGNRSVGIRYSIPV
jgi:protein TonB